MTIYEYSVQIYIKMWHTHLALR